MIKFNQKEMNLMAGQVQKYDDAIKAKKKGLELSSKGFCNFCDASNEYLRRKKLTYKLDACDVCPIHRDGEGHCLNSSKGYIHPQVWRDATVKQLKTARASIIEDCDVANITIADE